MRRLILISAVCLCALPLWAADYPRTELFGSAGWTHWWDNEGAPVDGFSVSGGVGRRLLPQFALEFETLGFFGRRGVIALGPEDRARCVQFTANGLLYVYRHPRARVFLLLGAGGAHSESKTDFGDFHASRSGTGFVGNAGMGAEIDLNDHWSLRPEFRLVAGNGGGSSVAPFTAEVRGSLGLAYRW